jgi:trehalose/maltose hydrolase-like predicted phosphorylase
MLKTNKQILNATIHICEENFFLNLAIRLNLNLATTKLQVKEIHKKISSNEKNLNDYSRELQKCYLDYLSFLGINTKFD